MTDKNEPEQIPEPYDVDAILDGIDEVIEDPDVAKEMVRSYVQKGGQGWSTFVDPSFFVGAATAGVVASATYDTFKMVVAKVVHLIQEMRGPVKTNVYAPDGSIDGNFEYILREAWETANAVLQEDVAARHTIDEATALHWALFVNELPKTEHLIRLDRKQFARLRRAGASRPERLTPTQMVSLIVDQWLGHNPNAEMGIWE